MQNQYRYRGSRTLLVVAMTSALFLAFFATNAWKKALVAMLLSAAPVLGLIHGLTGNPLMNEAGWMIVGSAFLVGAISAFIMAGPTDEEREFYLEEEERFTDLAFMVLGDFVDIWVGLRERKAVRSATMPSIESARQRRQLRAG
ncbi:hypothetical protein A3G06_02640 [Candidatus Nomurabacteria bacterium RIFCSPLOWO2_12_FULL_46_14]|uniref:Uncharacterized protein n=1 Tax=Candidatus Nomurabacteria bacterium RIFCSPLOWO2_12_FULL_46_14 TaxID=1801797 RepID=A0A1F6Y875_9BACT|nr:MAG: hypothetical protein A3G06_02640 [Candidatus Nomurabacteria bacterium RIFCSPLOWO2_12_FULL_46_14]